MNVAELIIAKLGGTRRAATLIGVPPSTVQSWKVSGLIPARHQMHILQVANGNGIALAPDDFFATDSSRPFGNDAVASPQADLRTAT